MKEFVIAKILYLKEALVSFLAAIFLPIQSSLLFIGLLIIADLILGIWAARKQKVRITSRKASDGTLPKLILYPLALIIASACQQQFPGIPFIKGAAFLIMAWELKSMEEKFSSILGINVLRYIKILITKGKQGIAEEILKTSHNEPES